MNSNIALEYITHNERETSLLARELAKTLKGGDVVCLFGDLGVGKTVFTKGICMELGTDDYINSPTFTIVNEYEAKDLDVYHFDMYRIEDTSELVEIGFLEYLSKKGICIIEWPENIYSELPKCRIDVKIERLSFDEEQKRKVTIVRNEA
ncbi:MAG: tRNA (adenosine(37)-N6)-threonylcarbamoyltransferase complex ATPase subunit type 1 TsaE [Ruminococcaceae bacterium]|nr:tRNA (adenosine(37)-N6)-threonylcarbamoyltransferase complex ATPase subunit type 1 TsaE [Oscillospiraceae bacterium]